MYSYIQWKNITPDFVVDISSTIDVKMAAVAAYKSQFFNPKSTEPQTPISSQNFIESIRYRAADLGRLVFTDYAEGFTTDRLLAVDSVFDFKINLKKNLCAKNINELHLHTHFYMLNGGCSSVG